MLNLDKNITDKIYNEYLYCPIKNQYRIDVTMIVKEIMIKNAVSTNSNDTVYEACLKYRDN